MTTSKFPFPAPAAADRPTANIPIKRAVNPAPVPAGATLESPQLYFNKELSWVDFNWRVLALAMDERTPLLERVKFVAITAGNLAGLPAIAVPIGFGQGRLPASLQLVGRAHSEETLVAIAAAYQEMTEWHRQSPDPRGARVDLGQ